jgi:hypothetical protein
VPGTRHSGKRSPSPSARTRHSGKSFFNFFCKRLRLVPPSNVPFLFRVPSSPSVALGEDGLPRVPVFPECHARGRPSSPSAILPRVQHSGKIGFSECPIFGSRGSSRHSGNYSSPVVCGLPPAVLPFLPRPSASSLQSLHHGTFLSPPPPSSFPSPTMSRYGGGEPWPRQCTGAGCYHCCHLRLRLLEEGRRPAGVRRQPGYAWPACGCGSPCVAAN